MRKELKQCRQFRVCPEHGQIELFTDFVGSYHKRRQLARNGCRFNLQELDILRGPSRVFAWKGYHAEWVHKGPARAARDVPEVRIGELVLSLLERLYDNRRNRKVHTL